MQTTFATVVEEVQNLSLEEKEELRQLLDKYLVEARREEIYQNFLDAKSRAQKGELTFSNDPNELQKMLEEE